MEVFLLALWPDSLRLLLVLQGGPEDGILREALRYLRFTLNELCLSRRSGLLERKM